MDPKISQLLQPVEHFLYCSTPLAWLSEARKPENLPVLLLDHLHCELKAAQSAAFLIRRYAPDSLLAEHVLHWLKPYEDFLYRGVGEGHFEGTQSLSRTSQQVRGDDPVVNELISKMVLLIKEELHHFEQVLDIMRERDIELQPISAARYAAGLRRHMRTHEPAAFIDKLIVGAYIEARSCERFAKLAPSLDAPLAKFYTSLLRSEARHYQDYLHLARMIGEQAGTPAQAIDDRIEFFGQLEAELIKSADPEFRFHSGKPEVISVATPQCEVSSQLE
ncbi:MAG: tRNA-(ms[2]io[6]A)-hydroxylase [Idiomarina sp.]|nr:tRNA-(ms[2]io[6]A)-hydroxylase [Idiomarina sp.]